MHINNILPISTFLVEEPLVIHFMRAEGEEDRFNIKRNFELMASYLIGTMPKNAERTITLRRLIDARDSALRCELVAMIDEITKKVYSHAPVPVPMPMVMRAQ